MITITNEKIGTVNIEQLTEQFDKDNRPFRKSGTRLLIENEKWIDRVLKAPTIHEFIYTDKKEGFFYVYMDYFNNFVKITFK